MYVCMYVSLTIEPTETEQTHCGITVSSGKAYIHVYVYVCIKFVSTYIHTYIYACIYIHTDPVKTTEELLVQQLAHTYMHT